MKEYIKMVSHDSMIITAYPDSNPINKLKIIAHELIENKFKGTIVFDLLVFNGNEFNRFVSITFDGLRFDKKNIKYHAHIDPLLEIEQNNFFINNDYLLSASVLSSKEISNFTYKQSSLGCLFS